MILLSGFVALLHHHTSQDTLVVGTVQAGIPRAELRGVLGPFFNTIALRLELSPDASFRALLRRARTVSLEALAHAEIPFPAVIEAVRPPKRSGVHPIFQVALTVEPEPAPLEAGWRISTLELDQHASKFDLTLFARETPEGMALRFEYSVDLFEAETIQRVMDQLCALLALASRDPDLPCSALTTRSFHDAGIPA